MKWKMTGLVIGLLVVSNFPAAFAAYCHILSDG